MLRCEKIGNPVWNSKELLWVVILYMNDENGIGRYEQEIKFQAIESYKNWLREYLASKSQRSK